ncbi:TPR-like protein [Tuber magnatum]|uniref:TPR-like protein n=1 Tax=Tuber magnatum TaxID=42249 RepID=A0A317T2P7_9PEZI|nr:TPR-like protein [Tuber magnatum]
MTNLGGTTEGRAMRARDGVPYCRNSTFTGREACQSGAHNRVALHGLGGCGKTQIALEYVYQCSSEGHCGVFWVQGSGILKFAEGFKAIAQHVRIPRVSGEKDEEGLLRRARMWLEGPHSGDWILVIDNADNDADFIGNTGPISKFVPQGRKGTVIFTTRSRQVAVRQSCKIIKVGKMEPEEALELFSKRFDSWHSLEDEEKRAAAMILNSMDYLPLAVVGSSAFMTENGTSPTVYWSIFQENDKRARELLLERFSDIQREVDMTENAPSGKPSRLIAFFGRQNIPKELLIRSGLEGMDDSLKFITEVKCEDTIFYELHRLIQLSIWAYLSMEQANQGRAAALQAISWLFPVYEYKRRNICAAYMSHEQVLTRDSSDTIAEDLVYRMGKHYLEMGSYIAVNNLAVVLRALGKYEESEVVNRHTLEGYEKSLGSDHRNTLRAVNNLALVPRDLGRYEDSEVVNRRALEGYKKSLGSDHPDTLGAINNLAHVLQAQGRYEESEMMNRRALEWCEKVFGLDHPTALMAVNDLARVLREQARYEELERVSRCALEGLEKSLGLGHPATLMAVNNLAKAQQEQGRYGESEVMNRRALEGFEKGFGLDRPATLMTVNNLALVLQEQGRYEESEAVNRRALQGSEKCFGSDHPKTLTAVNNLAVLLREQGRYAESEVMNRRALEGYEKSVGLDHPDTLIAINNLAQVLREQGRYEESESGETRVSPSGSNRYEGSVACLSSNTSSPTSGYSRSPLACWHMWGVTTGSAAASRECRRYGKARLRHSTRKKGGEWPKNGEEGG